MLRSESSFTSTCSELGSIGIVSVGVGGASGDFRVRRARQLEEEDALENMGCGGVSMVALAPEDGSFKHERVGFPALASPHGVAGGSAMLHASLHVRHVQTQPITNLSGV